MCAIRLCSSLLGVVLPLLGACNQHLARPVLEEPTTQATVPAYGRGEAVFRLQNAVMDELIVAQLPLLTSLDANDIELAGYEDRLVDECASINEAASLGVTGDRPGVGLKLRVLMSLSGCEHSALAARDFLIKQRTFISDTLP
jgi:hypothetical protein